MRRADSNDGGRGREILGHIVNRIWLGALAGCLTLTIASAAQAAPRSSDILSFGAGRPVPAGDIPKGRDTFDAVCWACHSRDLSGGKAPPLTGQSFYKVWQGKKVEALFDFILNTMPKDEPGLLSEPMARDLVAYIVAYSNRPGSTRK